MKLRGLFGLVVAVLLCSAGPAQASLLVLDTFDVPQNLTALGPANTSSGSVSGAGIYGGERDMVVTTTAGIPVLGLNTQTLGANQLAHSADATVTGFTLLQWDGVDGSSTLNPVGLGGADLTNGGLVTGLGIRVSLNDLPADITLTVYDASDPTGLTFSQASLSLPGGIFSDTDFLVNFASFTTDGPNGAADFTNAGAVEMLIDGAQQSTDLVFSFIQPGSTLVPEPMSAAVWSLCLVTGLVVVARRKRSVVA